MDSGRALPLAVPECVHCGFCLPVCPTYEALGTEMDSPRGRLHIMKALDEGRIEPTEPVVRHLDLCLGCRACESECPSGVSFGAKLEKTREGLRDAAVRPRGQRMIEGAALWAVGASPSVQWAGAMLLSGLDRVGLTRLASHPSFSALLPGRLAAASRLACCVTPGSAGVAEVTPAAGERRMRVGLLLGCVGRWMFGHVNAATVRLLSGAGCEVVAPAGQVCCGALHAHAGDRAGARRLARINIEAFERAGGLDAIVVNAAGCGSVMKEYGQLFSGEGEGGPGGAGWTSRGEQFAGKVRDALELLAQLGLPGTPREVHRRIAYHDACHLAHAQGIRSQPRTLLESIPGIELLPLADADRCCGSAGIYNLLHPDVAAEILAPKLDRLRRSGADVVAAANPGCLLQIAAGARGAGMPLRAMHPLEILDESLSGR
jgi:glycolate oxidase iron-sulfur subunit